MTYKFLSFKNMDKLDKKDDNLSSKLNLETAGIASSISKNSLSEGGPIQVNHDYILGPNSSFTNSTEFFERLSGCSIT